MSYEITVVSVLCFILMIKPFHYFLSLFHHREHSLVYKGAHLLAVVVVTVFMIVVMNDLSHSPSNLFLLSPFLMVTTLLITSLFLLSREVLSEWAMIRGPVMVLFLRIAGYSIFRFWQESHKLFNMLGGGVDDPASVIYQMSWINPHTSTLIVNGFLFLFLCSITVVCSSFFGEEGEPST